MAIIVISKRPGCFFDQFGELQKVPTPPNIRFLSGGEKSSFLDGH